MYLLHLDVVNVVTTREHRRKIHDVQLSRCRRLAPVPDFLQKAVKIPGHCPHAVQLRHEDSVLTRPIGGNGCSSHRTNQEASTFQNVTSNDFLVTDRPYDPVPESSNQRYRYQESGAIKTSPSPSGCCESLR